MDSGCSIYIYIMFRMDNTKVYVIYELGMFVWFVFRMDNTKVYLIYELGMFVWFVLYYVTDLDVGFVDF